MTVDEKNDLAFIIRQHNMMCKLSTKRNDHSSECDVPYPTICDVGGLSVNPNLRLIVTSCKTGKRGEIRTYNYGRKIGDFLNYGSEFVFVDPVIPFFYYTRMGTFYSLHASLNVTSGKKSPNTGRRIANTTVHSMYVVNGHFVYGLGTDRIDIIDLLKGEVVTAAFNNMMIPGLHAMSMCLIP